MTRIKIRFRPSTVAGKEGTLYCQVVHGRQVRQLRREYRIFQDEWDERLLCVRTEAGRPGRGAYLAWMQARLSAEKEFIAGVVRRLEESGRTFTAGDVVEAFRAACPAGQGYFSFARQVMARLRETGRVRVAEAYASSLNPNRSLDIGEIARLCHAACFSPSRRRSGLRRGVARIRMRTEAGKMPESLTFPIKNGLGVSNDRFGLNRFARFAGKEDLCFGDVSAELMAGFEAHLADAGLKPNTVSFYMRNLRAIYNRAVEKGLAEQNHPFRHVYTGVEQTAKRAVPVRVMNRIRQLDLSAWPSRELARDLFLFSFYTRGMSFVDMAFLKKKDLRDGILVYRRQKTKKQLSIRWEKPMQGIVARHGLPDSPFLLPIIRHAGKEERRQYLNAIHWMNKALNPNRSLDSPSVFPVFEEGCFCASCSLLSASCSSLRLDVARYAFG